MVLLRKKKHVKEDLRGLSIPAGLFIGMGLGFLYNELVAGLFLGLGAGFLLAAILYAIKK